MKYMWVVLTPDNWRWIALDLERQHQSWMPLYRFAREAAEQRRHGTVSLLLRTDERDRVYDAKQRRYDSRRPTTTADAEGRV